MAQLNVNQLTKSFGKRVMLNDVSLALTTGSITSVLGRNGCGKSTLLKILFGVMKADAMSINYNGNSINQNDIIPNQLIAYLPQQPFIPMQKKLRDIVPMFFNEGDMQDKVFYSYNMHKLADTKAGKLSLGELRYFELLLIAHSPHPFILLDEPFSMIEPLYKERIKELLLSLKSTKGILVTDHYYRDVLEISTKSLLLKDGTLIRVNNEQELRMNGYLPDGL